MRAGRAGFLVLFLLPVLLIATRLSGQIRHSKARQAIEHEIVYLEPWGEAQAGENGIVCFHDRLIPGSSTKHKDLLLNAKYWGSYPLFYAETPIRYQIRLRNNTPKTLKQLRVLAIPKIMGPSGGWEAVENVEELPDWFIETLEPKQSIILTGEMKVNQASRKAGLIQTYLQIRQPGGPANSSSRSEVVLADTAQAAVWCAAPSSP